MTKLIRLHPPRSRFRPSRAPRDWGAPGARLDREQVLPRHDLEAAAEPRDVVVPRTRQLRGMGAAQR